MNKGFLIYGTLMLSLTIAINIMMYHSGIVWTNDKTMLMGAMLFMGYFVSAVVFFTAYCDAKNSASPHDGATAL